MVDTFMILDMIPEVTNYMDTQIIFNTIPKPKITIKEFACRLYKYMIQDSNILTFIYYYIAVYVTNCKIKVDQYNIHRLFLASTTVAHKFWYDFSLDNKDIAKIGGVDKKELNKLELVFLEGIEWNVYKVKTVITYEEFIQIAECLTGLNYKVIDMKCRKKQDTSEKIEIEQIVKKIIDDIINDVIKSAKTSLL